MVCQIPSVCLLRVFLYPVLPSSFFCKPVCWTKLIKSLFLQLQVGFRLCNDPEQSRQWFQQPDRCARSNECRYNSHLSDHRLRRVNLSTKSAKKVLDSLGSDAGTEGPNVYKKKSMHQKKHEQRGSLEGNGVMVWNYQKSSKISSEFGLWLTWIFDFPFQNSVIE